MPVDAARHSSAKKNPYLYRAKDIQTAEPLVRNILDAYLSSQEEGMFGGNCSGMCAPGTCMQ
ncbi:MAG: hypothetical protein K6U78_11050 [Anaerolineae bacterium]|nr:hypothetical protein [Anaerolineae bacterium]